MVKSRLKVIIDDEAKRAFREAYQYIKRDSLQNAEKVRVKLLASIKALPTNPERYAPDKYRLNNDGAYRAYEILKYRVTYYIGDSVIRIIRIRHVRMNPLEY
ncbi:type II toxin-antitoxin system RelE/ParE family toxin [Niabella sp.]|uniref:type II toxin-antitoxin system RelE/ParE family toxin n=1 Tax=Niabella sp. TaxID=1962976 RepID=UPI0034559811